MAPGEILNDVSLFGGGQTGQKAIKHCYTPYDFSGGATERLGRKFIERIFILSENGSLAV